MASSGPADVFWITTGTLVCLWGVIDVLVRRRQTARSRQKRPRAETGWLRR